MWKVRVNFTHKHAQKRSFYFHLRTLHAIAVVFSWIHSGLLYPLRMENVKTILASGTGPEVWRVVIDLSGYKTSLALSASAEALGHARELLCPLGSCRSSLVNGLQVPRSPRRIAASPKMMGNPAHTPAAQVPTWTLQRTRDVVPASHRANLLYLW